MVYVSLSNDLPFNEAAQAYARMLAEFLSTERPGPFFGNLGRFERNVSATQSGIWKLHLRLTDEGGWPASQKQSERKSDNFLIYAQHWDCRDHYQILAILSPDAHKQADKVLPSLISNVEKDFHSLSERDLKSLLHVSV
ncbi:TPA: type II toxin-antitoxin system YafO family toxin [Klebsiella aerogenes]